MRNSKRFTAALFSLLFIAGFATACSKEPTSKNSTAPSLSKQVAVSTEAKTTAAATSALAAASSNSQEELREFTDSAGRKLMLPQRLNKVAPSGSLAQVFIYTAFPDKLCGVARKFSPAQLKFFPPRFADLPEFGQFYGKKANLNMEALLAAKPDVIVDVGEAKKTIVEDMDRLQEQLKIPVVFIESHLDTVDRTYEKMAELFQEKADTAEQAAYCRTALDKAKAVREALQPDEMVKVYWAMGDKGLNTNAEKSFQAEVLQLVGADNVVKADAVSRGGGTIVSMEDLLQWKPQVILVEPGLELMQEEAFATLITKDKIRLLHPPHEPFGALSNPPSVNRILGLYYLGQKLYPEAYKIDLPAEIKRFYKLFYHSELSDAEATAMAAD